MTMMVKQWLLSQSPSPHFLSDPFKAGPVKRILLASLESGQLSSKWREALPEKLFHKHTKHASKCIHIDFKEILQFRYPASALIVTNALMMTTPLDALAQTCEADTSVFNMPLLLLVALIGATVGGASLQRQGKYREAIEYHSMVLDISARNGGESGSTEAYGAIADCYTELGDMERAAKYYDQYIERLQSD